MSYIGNTQQNQSYVPAVDFFSGDGSTTAFTLSKPVATTAQIQAVISNVPQTPGVAYTVSGSTITFTSAPPSGTNNIYIYYTSPNTQVVQPGQGTVGNAQMSTGAPVWDASGNNILTGNLTLDNGLTDGAQVILKSSGYDDWNIDNYSGSLRFYNGSTVMANIDSSGRVTMPYQPCFQAGKSNQTNPDSIIGAWDVVAINTGGHFNSSNGRFTAPVTGRYCFQWAALGNNLTTVYRLTLAKNGSFYINGLYYQLRIEHTGSGNFPASTASAFAYVNLSAGDYVQVHFNSDSGALLYSDAAFWTKFSGHLIG